MHQPLPSQLNPRTLRPPVASLQLRPALRYLRRSNQCSRLEYLQLRAALRSEASWIATPPSLDELVMKLQLLYLYPASRSLH